MVGRAGRAVFLAAGLSLALVAGPPGDLAAQEVKKTQRAAKAAEPARPKPANIDKNGVLILVRSSLLALDQANKTGNYTVLRDLGAPGFHDNTSAKLAEIFATQRNQAVDLAGVAVLEPQLTLLPQIESNGMLHMAGFFPSVPLQLNFEFYFAPVDRQWKLYGLSVNVGSSAPLAPEGPTQPDSPASTAPPEPPSAAISSGTAPKSKR